LCNNAVTQQNYGKEKKKGSKEVDKKGFKEAKRRKAPPLNFKKLLEISKTLTVNGRVFVCPDIHRNFVKPVSLQHARCRGLAFLITFMLE